MKVKPKDIRVTRLGKVSGTYVLSVPKANRVFIYTPSRPSLFSLKRLAHNISYIIHLQNNASCGEIEVNALLDLTT